MPIVAMHIPRPVPCGLGEFFLCSYEKKNAEMVAHTISAAFVVNATTEVSIKSSNFAP